jgi:hypothetical protein
LTPYVFLAAAPKQPARATTLTRQQGVRQLLEQPPATRHDGWNLVTLERARIAGGPKLEISNGTRKHLSLHDDGTFLAVGTVPGFLAWHRRDLPNKINALALIEFTYNFLLVYDRVLSDLDPLPRALRLRLGLRHAHEYNPPVYMAYGRIDRFDYEIDSDVRPAPADAFEHSIDIPVTDVPDGDTHFDLGTVTYQLVVPLYNWFGFEDEAVPYTDDDRTRIEIDQITTP